LIRSDLAAGSWTGTDPISVVKIVVMPSSTVPRGRPITAIFTTESAERWSAGALERELEKLCGLTEPR